MTFSLRALRLVSLDCNPLLQQFYVWGFFVFVFLFCVFTQQLGIIKEDSLLFLVLCSQQRLDALIVTCGWIFFWQLDVRSGSVFPFGTLRC